MNTILDDNACLANTGDADEALPNGAGIPGSGSHVGLMSGLLTVISPEQEQHLEFSR